MLNIVFLNKFLNMFSKNISSQFFIVKVITVMIMTMTMLMVMVKTTIKINTRIQASNAIMTFSVICGEQTQTNKKGKTNHLFISMPRLRMSFVGAC